MIALDTHSLMDLCKRSTCNTRNIDVWTSNCLVLCSSGLCEWLINTYMYMHMNSICTCIYIRLTNQSVLARGRAGTLPTHTPRIVTGYAISPQNDYQPNLFLLIFIMDDVNISIIFDYVGRYTYMWQECHVAADGQSPECVCRCHGAECLAPGVICDTSA